MARGKAGFTDEDDALLADLGIEVEPERKGGHTAREERIIAGFEDIQRFVDQHRRPPRHGEGLDIFERLYAVRLDRIRALPECRALLEPLDRQGLLTDAVPAPDDELDDDALLAELGMGTAAPDDIGTLRHVRPAEARNAPDDIASREKCADFDRFRPLFEQVQRELSSGLRATRRFERKSEIAPGRFYILAGQKAYVASMEAPRINDHGTLDGRLRVIFDNGTESNLLMRSFQKALQQDETGRRILDPAAGPLFAAHVEAEDEASGTVYVLRSRSDHPSVAAHRDLVHKIGVTGGEVARRVVGARLDPTFLMADVDIIASYDLFNIDRARLEAIIHRVFAPARLDITIIDRFGHPVVPQEWFLVPLFAIDEAIERIRDGTITGYEYDPATATLARTASPR